MTRSVYLKRKYLHEYEYVQRQANEPIRSFCNRYGRIERSLKSVNISVEGMYDGESRGARLLERMRLGLEQQRLILVASNQSLEFDTIREAAQIQFPDHRPTPQVVFNREFDGEKRQEPSSQRATTPQPQHRSQKGSGKGSKGQGKGKSHPGSLYKSTAYVTEIAENNAQTGDDEETYQEEQPAEDDAEEEELATIQEADEEGGEQEEDLVADLAEVARCLTVTARRLQGMTLGRKFTGGSKTIAQRKAETHCAVCGMKGHWQGDSECPQSGNSNGGKGGKTSTPGNKKPEAKGQAKKVMTVTYGNGRREIPINDTPEETYGTRFQTFMIRSSIPNKVLANNITSFKEYMVLDTACQRTCCSTKWYKEWSKEVKQRGLHALEVVSQEPFEFGHGPTQYSHTHAYLPVNFDRQGLHRFLTSEGMNSFFTDKAYVIKNPEALEDEDTLDDAEAPDEIYLTDFVKGEPTSFKIPENVKSGNKAWIAGHLMSQRKTYENEINADKSLLSHQECVKEGTKTDMMVLDLIEVFAGKARLTDLAHRYGLSASQPFDIKYGIDLKTKAGRDTLKKAVKTLKPLLLLVAWPCAVWNIFNRNMNYSYRLDELESLRDEDRPLVKLGVELCYEQIEGGRFYLGENPLRSDLWKESHVCQLRQHADNIEVTGDAGAYGAENRDGWPIQKPHRWITNSKTLAENLSKKMTPEQKLYTKPVEGKDTAPSGEYCDGLVNAILAGLQQEAKARNPQRFHAQKNSAKVFYVKPFHDEDAWKDILDEAERRFTNTYKKPIILGESDELMPKIQQLVPWEISRVQLAWTPAARRWPIDVSFTHRGCALRTMPGAFRLEHEDENSVKYPQQRFTESIRVGIFFYGFAGEEEEEKKYDEAAEAGGQSKRVIGVSTDITFEGGPPMSPEMQASVARLHCNLGHPPKQEIVRILAAAGKLDSKILAALDALRCGSCIRMSKTVKPTTSSTSASVKYSGAFGDHLQSDIIFIRLLTGEAVPVLGMICMSTNYHAAAVLDSRVPDHVLNKMIEIWYKPLGLPVSITVDADTCYQAKNQAWHQNLGIEYDIIPTEEAWRLGKIGKRNALMRTLAERLIDQNAAVTRRQLDEILVAVVFSMNSSTYTYGRSPYQAVFGRIPRPVGDILSDSKALTISTQPPTRNPSCRSSQCLSPVRCLTGGETSNAAEDKEPERPEPTSSRSDSGLLADEWQEQTAQERLLELGTLLGL